MRTIFIKLRFSILLPDIRAGPPRVFKVRHHKQPHFFMPQTPTDPIRIFALDPTTKGFGYAVFETPFHLVDWGLAHVSGEKESGAIARFEELLDQYRPDIVILEDSTAPGSRRRPRVQKLLERLRDATRERSLAVHLIPRLAVIECFSAPDKRATKHSITQRLAETFPASPPKCRSAARSGRARMSASRPSTPWPWR